MVSMRERFSLAKTQIKIFSSPFILKLAIILALLASIVLISVTIVKQSSLKWMIVAAILPGILALIFCIRYLEKSPLIILLVAGFIPFGVSTGTESKVMLSMVMTGLFLGIWLVRKFVVEKKIYIEPSPVNMPLLGFVIVAIIAQIWSDIFLDPFIHVSRNVFFVKSASTAVMVLLPLSLLLVSNLIHEEKTLRWMVGIILVIGGLNLVIRFLNINLPVNAGGITPMWVVALSVSLALFDRGLSRAMRIGLLVLAGASIVWGFVLHIDWLAGWLPGFIALGVISLTRSWKLSLALLVILLAVFLLNSTYFQKDISSETLTSGNTRMAAWQINWNITSQHILFGTGPGGYAAYYMTYFPYEAMATHSNYIDILAETGIVGTSLYLWLFGSLFVVGLRLVRKLRGRGDFIEALAISGFAGTIGCIVIMGFGDWLIPFAYTQTIAGFNYEVYSWLFMGTLLVIDGMIRRGIIEVPTDRLRIAE